ncbi:MAG: molybdopterin molybdotransferase MoeA [Solirubrobacterales bacterium]|nr:molybdopterin molybdotransferase MoeA [Solirubrobacterales bacterium]
MPSPLITITEAQQRVIERVRRLESERVRVEDGLDRVLAEDLVAAEDVPPFASSAMDGYAVLAGAAGRLLTVVGESRAGAPSPRSLGEGEAIRISTGACVPAGATAVIAQENVQQRDGQIETGAAVGAGENVRHAGEDLRAASTVLRSGTRLGAWELGAAVAAGAAELVVSRPPRVAVLCTGDELRAPGEPLGPGEIHNSNAPMLVALSERCGGLAGSAGRLADDRSATEAGLSDALERADVVVVSGGVSVGPHDHVKPALARLGVQELFWGVALQPGKPTWFGVRDHTLVFDLPGNPVSAVVTFTLFVAPALSALQGALPERRLELEAELGVGVARNPRREQALRVRLERGDGRPVATPNGPQGSHVITSLLGAHALAMIPPGTGELPAGTVVRLEELLD